MSSPTTQAWFIEPQRHPGSAIRAHTDGNQVTSLIDEEYMQAAYRLISKASKGDTLCIAGLRMDDVRLLGNSQKDSALLQLLASARKNGANVHVLLDGNLLHREANEASVAFLRRNGVNAIIDYKRPKIFGSQHQKLICLQRNDSTITALLGSADLWKGRQDNKNHDVRSVDRGKSFLPTHESGVRIEGPATEDLLRGFYDRLGRNDPIPEQEPKGSHQVQVLRTYAQTENGYQWSKQGEFTILDAYLNAIRNAKKMIYIEDQYFWMNQNNHPENDIIIELGKAIRRGVKVAVVVPSEFERAPLLDLLGPRLRRKGSIDYLKGIAENAKQDGGDFSIATLRKVDGKTGKERPIYVHSKCLCVDDEFVLTGSANVNDRSMYYDSELSVGIYDPEKTFARRHLRRLLTEHLDMEPNSLEHHDLDAAYALFKEASDGRKGRLIAYVPTRLFTPSWIADRIMRGINPGVPPVKRRHDKESADAGRIAARPSDRELSPPSRRNPVYLNPVHIPQHMMTGNNLYKRNLPPNAAAKSAPPILGY